ncbi:hypothetical protein [Spirosoma flavum]|uniref:PAS fold-2 domain-containing protein n=1 Tax=Spirosoma flavum TaxID=2048557 RepID=A0ABW6AI79_9BACT
MTTKGIRFTGYTTLANCESEPIHVPGTTQPYGLLMAVNSQTWLIDYCSANTVDFLDLDVNQVVGKALAEIIGEQECDKMNRHLTDHTPEQVYTLTYQSVSFITALSAG